jgi:hypothetical protein
MAQASCVFRTPWTSCSQPGGLQGAGPGHFTSVIVWYAVIDDGFRVDLRGGLLSEAPSNPAPDPVLLKPSGACAEPYFPRTRMGHALRCWGERVDVSKIPRSRGLSFWRPALRIQKKYRCAARCRRVPCKRSVRSAILILPRRICAFIGVRSFPADRVSRTELVDAVARFGNGKDFRSTPSTIPRGVLCR